MDRPEPVTQSVILAAGSGSRLASARGDVPKPLMAVAGMPLIGHALAHARSAGCTEAIVVIGYEGRRVRAAVEEMESGLQIGFAENPDFSLPNGVSLLAAAPLAAARFYLQMVDHLFASPVLRRLTDLPFDSTEGGRVLVDRTPVNLDLEDATKVRLESLRVKAIGKGLDPWDAIDAGCFVLSHEIFDALRQGPEGHSRTVSSGMRELVASNRLTAIDVGGVEWMDVDTPADREAAERLLSTSVFR